MSDDSYLLNLWLESKHKIFLGSGTFGTVVSCRNESTRELFALKAMVFQCCEANKDAHSAEINHLKNIYSTLAKMKHKNIAKIDKFNHCRLAGKEIQNFLQDLKTTGNGDDSVSRMIRRIKSIGSVYMLFIQMERCGDTLEQYLRNTEKYLRDVQNPEPTIAKQEVTLTEHNYLERMKVGIIKGLINGVEFLHQNKIIHKRLHPRNIYFTHNRNTTYCLPVKIGDAGITNRSCEIHEKPICRDYMAHETLDDVYEYGTDIFALGLIIWEVLQQIPKKKKAFHFDKLTNGRELNLISDDNCSILQNASQLICNLTERKPENRKTTFSLDEVHFTSSFASDSDELQHVIKNLRRGDVIQIGPGIYHGSILINRDDVILQGIPGETLLLPNAKDSICLHVQSSRCMISGISIYHKNQVGVGILVVGSKNCLQNVKVTKFGQGVVINGESNNLIKFEVNQCHKGILINGNDNNIFKSFLVESGLVAMELIGSKCKVEELVVDKADRGIVIHGGHNIVSQITHNHYGTYRANSFCVCVIGGEDNELTSVMCEDGRVKIFNNGQRTKIHGATCDILNLNDTRIMTKCNITKLPPIQANVDKAKIICSTCKNFYLPRSEISGLSTDILNKEISNPLKHQIINVLYKVRLT